MARRTSPRSTTTTSAGISRATSDWSISGRRPEVAIPYPVTPERNQQLDGSGQRTPLGQDLAEDLAVPALDGRGLLVGQAAPDLASDGPREETATHPDAPVDTPAVDRMTGFEERPLPGEHVGVDRIHEGPRVGRPSW